MSAIPKREDFEEIIPRHDAQFTVDGTNTIEVEVRVARGGAIAGKVLKSKLRVVISSGVGTLTGRIVSQQTGEGLSNLVVLLAPVESEKQRFRTTYLTARTDPSGRYSVSGAAGEYFVFERRREELPPIVSEEFVKNQAAKAKRVVILSGQSNRMDLREQ